MLKAYLEIQGLNSKFSNLEPWRIFNGFFGVFNFNCTIKIVLQTAQDLAQNQP